MFNKEKLKQIDRELRNELNNNKEKWGTHDKNIYNLSQTINFLNLLIKGVENGRDSSN